MRILEHIVTPAEDGPAREASAAQPLAAVDNAAQASEVERRDPSQRPERAGKHPAHTGDVLTVDVSDPPGSNEHICPVDFPLDILYEDEDLLVLNKPAGIAIHSAALTEETVTVAGSVVHYLGQDSFHCVNRLDRGTTGAMVVARRGYMHARCMALLHSGDFYREYRGVCLGQPQPPAGEITLPIGATRRPSCGGGSTRRGCRRGRCTRRSPPAARSRCCACYPPRGARISCASTSPPSAIRSPGIGSTARRTARSSPVRRSTAIFCTCASRSAGADITVTAPIPGDMTRLIQKEAL